MRSLPKFQCHRVHFGRDSDAVVKVGSTDSILTNDNAVLDLHGERWIWIEFSKFIAKAYILMSCAMVFWKPYWDVQIMGKRLSSNYCPLTVIYALATQRRHSLDDVVFRNYSITKHGFCKPKRYCGGYMDKGSLILHPKFLPWSLKGDRANRWTIFEVLTDNVCGYHCGSHFWASWPLEYTQSTLTAWSRGFP